MMRLLRWLWWSLQPRHLPQPQQWRPQHQRQRRVRGWRLQHERRGKSVRRWALGVRGALHTHIYVLVSHSSANVRCDE